MNPLQPSFSAADIERFMNNERIDRRIRLAFMAEVQWQAQARPKQIMPSGDWQIWMLLAGRGFGKTLCGAHAVRRIGLQYPDLRIGVVAKTEADLRETIFKGVSGIRAVVPEDCIDNYLETYNKMTLWNGTIVQGYSAESPERLRGPQSHFFWLDELAAWNAMREMWDQINFGLRLKIPVGPGMPPIPTRKIITTTPKGYPLIKEVVGYAHGIRPRTASEKWKIPKTVLTSGSTRENLANLADEMANDLMQYDGTDKGREEIDAEVLDLDGVAPLKMHWWKGWTEPKLPTPELVVMSLDTAGKDETSSDPSACTVWAVYDMPSTNTYRDPMDPLKVAHTVQGSTWIAVLIAAWQERLQYPELKERVVADFRKYARFMDYDPKTDGETDPPVVPLIEEQSTGIALVQELRRAGIPVVAYRLPKSFIRNKGSAGKRERADIVSDLLKDGLIWAPGKMMSDGRRSSDEFVPFAKRVAAEIGEFTGETDGEPDHYLDTCTQAWTYLRNRGYLTKRGDVKPRIVRPREEEEIEERLQERESVQSPYG